MTDAATIETTWVTDAELIRRSGVPEKIMRQNLRAFDAKNGELVCLKVNGRDN